MSDTSTTSSSYDKYSCCEEVNAAETSTGGAYNIYDEAPAATASIEALRAQVRVCLLI